jgi:hypothetical protein
MGNDLGDAARWRVTDEKARRAIKSAAFVFPGRIAHHRPLSSGGLRLFVICVGQTWKLPGFKHPAREMPTPPGDYIPLRAALRRRRRAYFLRRVAIWNEREFQ